MTHPSHDTEVEQVEVPALSAEMLQQRLDAMPGDKVTQQSIEARILATTFFGLADTTVTICSITMVNGFSVRGESACVDPANFDIEIGRQLAYRDAFSKLWRLEGYLLAERRFAEGQA
mgnify:CR=1 FL=1